MRNAVDVIHWRGRAERAEAENRELRELLEAAQTILERWTGIHNSQGMPGSVLRETRLWLARSSEGNTDADD